MPAVTVKDLTISLDEYPKVSIDASLKEALIALEETRVSNSQDRHYYRYRAVLVIDQQGRVVGKLSHWAILRSIEPSFLSTDDYARLADSGVSQVYLESIRETFSLFSVGLERLCREAAKVKVRDAMVTMKESIDENADLASAIHLMVLGHWQSVLVTRDHVVVGILRLSDVFEEVSSMIRSG